MAKKAFGALLLTALPLSAVLVGCSDSNAAESSMPEKAGAESKLETSAPLPPVPSDAELQQGNEADTDSSMAEPTGSTSPHMVAPSQTESVDDPYLPPQAYIPPPPRGSSSATPTTTTEPSTTVEVTETTSERVPSPKPSKPVPLLPEDNPENPKDNRPQDSDSSTETKPPSAGAQSQSGPKPPAPAEPSPDTPPKDSEFPDVNEGLPNLRQEPRDSGDLGSFLNGGEY